MSHWPEPKKKKKERIIIPDPPVLCKYGVKAHYNLVPSEHGIGYWCGHMVDYDEVGYFCGKHEIVFWRHSDQGNAGEPMKALVWFW